MSAAQGAFRLGVFSSATQRTVSAVLPMLEAAAVAGGGPSAPLFSDQRLVLPKCHHENYTPFPAFLRPDEYMSLCLFSGRWLVLTCVICTSANKVICPDPPSGQCIKQQPLPLVTVHYNASSLSDAAGGRIG